jgi:hypothetical protein
VTLLVVPGGSGSGGDTGSAVYVNNKHAGNGGDGAGGTGGAGVLPLG